MIFEILIVVVLIFANGLFAMSEIAIVSAKPSQLEERARKGHKGAKIALALADQPTQFLSTIQVGITLIGIIAGAYGGSTLAAHLVAPLSGIALIAPYSETIAFVLVVGSITFFSLIIGELVPKRLALGHAEGIAATTAPFMLLLSRIALPVVKLLTFTSDIALWILRVDPDSKNEVSEEEVNYLVNAGTDSGVFDPVEREMVRRVLHLDTLAVSSVMTPRAEIIWYDVADSPEANWKRIADSTHSYFPVSRDSLDENLGIANVKDIWFAATQQSSVRVEDHLREPIITTEHIPVLEVLDEFKKTGRSYALVLDEFGVIRGLVTLKDILEAITGEIPSAEDTDDPASIVEREDGSYIIDATLSMYDFKMHFGLPDDFFGTSENEYASIAGFIIDHYKAIPTAGMHFTVNDWRFEVLDMDGHRVDSVLVTRSKKNEI